MSVSMSISNLNLDKTSLELDNLYRLKEIKNEALVLSKAYRQVEYYYNTLHQILTFLTIIIGSINSVLSGILLESKGDNVTKNSYFSYILLGLSILSVFLMSVEKTFSPRNKQHDCNKIAIEFQELSGSIDVFEVADKTKEEIQFFTRQSSFYLDTWKALAPIINSKYILNARKEMAMRPKRVRSPRSKKNESDG